MSRATYRCTSGHSTRRKAIHKGIKCPKCGLLASMVDPTPGRPCAPLELSRVDFRIRPIGISVQVLGANEARRIGAAAIDEAAKRKYELDRARAEVAAARCPRTRRPAKS